MKSPTLRPSKGFLMMELALSLLVLGGLVALLMPLLAMQGQLDTVQRDSQAMKQARDALLQQAVAAWGLPGPLAFKEDQTSSSGLATSHLELKTDANGAPITLALGWAGALPGALLGVPTVSPLQTAYWYDVQPALRSDSNSAFFPAVEQSQSSWAFRSITEQFDPDINKQSVANGGRPQISTGGVRTQLCRNLNSLVAIEQAIRQYGNNNTNEYARDNINVVLPRIWTTGYETSLTWDPAEGFATLATSGLDAVFENSSAAAFVVVRRQPPALRRLDRGNAVYPQVGTTGLDQPLASRGAVYPASASAGTRGFRVYENPLTSPADHPGSDTRDYDGRVQAVSLNEFASALRQAGLCTAPAEACKANQLFIRFSNYVNSVPISGNPQGLTMRWELMDRDPGQPVDQVVQSGELDSGSISSGQCLDAFAADVRSKPNTRYLRVSFKTPAGSTGYADGGNYWYRGAILVDPTLSSPLPAADDGVNRWRNLGALSAAEGGKTVTIHCTGSHSLLADGQLNRSGTSKPTCSVTQLP